MGMLRTKMEQNLRARGVSAHTCEKYLHTVEALTRHYGRPPDITVKKNAIPSPRPAKQGEG